MKRSLPFKRTPNGKYYFRYSDADGNRNQKCTGTYDYDEALLIMKAFMGKVVTPDIPTFRDELRLYQSIDTNPKFKTAQIDGSHYSRRYAQTVAYKAKKLEQICLESCPELFMLKLDEFTRRDAKRLTEAIVASMGHCRTAQICQQVMKGIFSEAVQDGVIQVSPAFGQKCIKYDQKERYAVPNEWLAWVIDSPDLFLDREAWAFFSIAATTGMRRSEILALSTEQLKGDVLTINRNLLGTGKDSEIGLPKWDIIRTIPISDITLQIIKSLKPYPNGRYFYRSSAWVQKVFDNLKATLNGLDKEHEDFWCDLTPHVLRHSFNTNLLVAGVNDNLIAEYLGWQHQGKLLDIQHRYTHFITKHLRPVSQKVDEIYAYNEELLLAL